MKITNIANSFFLGITGTFSSYGFGSSQMIMGQNYAYCIRSYLKFCFCQNILLIFFNRPAAGYCCIEYTPVTWSVFAGSLGSDMACTDPTADNQNSCAGAVNCNVNFIVVPGVQSPQTCQTNGQACYGHTDGRDR